MRAMAGDSGSGVDWESLAEATSGAIGALVSTTVLYPLDTCKTKFQAELQTHQGTHKYRYGGPAPFPRLSSFHSTGCNLIRTHGGARRGLGAVIARFWSCREADLEGLVIWI